MHLRFIVCYAQILLLALASACVVRARGHVPGPGPDPHAGVTVVYGPGHPDPANPHLWHCAAGHRVRGRFVCDRWVRR
jgi:hypothetical protein